MGGNETELAFLFPCCCYCSRLGQEPVIGNPPTVSNHPSTWNPREGVPECANRIGVPLSKEQHQDLLLIELRSLGALI